MTTSELLQELEEKNKKIKMLEANLDFQFKINATLYKRVCKLEEGARKLLFRKVGKIDDKL